MLVLKQNCCWKKIYCWTVGFWILTNFVNNTCCKIWERKGNVLSDENYQLNLSNCPKTTIAAVNRNEAQNCFFSASRQFNSIQFNRTILNLRNLMMSRVGTVSDRQISWDICSKTCDFVPTSHLVERDALYAERYFALDWNFRQGLFYKVFPQILWISDYIFSPFWILPSLNYSVSKRRSTSIVSYPTKQMTKYKKETEKGKQYIHH